ncbi:MAG: NAD-dependent protein deacylase [Bacteroidia bacterium]|nr:NAD-dependent protein deacylase [Bacteroidia bacterium]
MKRLVVFTGAGISAESGIKTFRDSGGLWENYKVEDVATPQAWSKNPSLVQEFYNQRRKQLFDAKPNAGHFAIAELQKHFNVQVITQNVDDLHERAGSENVLHLHGELMKVRSCDYPELIYTVKHWEIKMGDLCERGSQLRPHIVWFGEMVPQMDNAVELVQQADIFIVAGTSLNVYPAANLLDYAPADIPKFYVDPNPDLVYNFGDIQIIKDTAGKGLPELAKQLVNNFAV